MTTAATPAPPSQAGHHGHDDHHGHHPNQAHHFESLAHQYDAGKLGIWIFLVTEVLFFSGLFCAYTVYRANHPEVFVYAHEYLDKFWGAFNTCVLLFSSLTMAWAVRCAQVRNRGGLILMLSLTLICAFGFLVIKYIEYSHKWHQGLLWAGQFDPEYHIEGAHHGPMTWMDRVDEVKDAFGLGKGHGADHGGGHDAHGAGHDDHGKSHGTADHHGTADAHGTKPHGTAEAHGTATAHGTAAATAPHGTATATAAPTGTAAVTAVAGTATGTAPAPAAPVVEVPRAERKAQLLAQRTALDTQAKELAAAQAKLDLDPLFAEYQAVKAAAEKKVADAKAALTQIEDPAAKIDGLRKTLVTLITATGDSALTEPNRIRYEYADVVLVTLRTVPLPAERQAALESPIRTLQEAEGKRKAALAEAKQYEDRRKELSANPDAAANLKDTAKLHEEKLKEIDRTLLLQLQASVLPAIVSVQGVLSSEAETRKNLVAAAEKEAKELEGSAKFAAVAHEQTRIQTGLSAVSTGRATLRVEAEKFLREPALAKVFFSIYFGMTGLHGIHVLIGIALITWILIRAIRGEFMDGYYEPVDFIGLYWHLVDLIWIYLFPLLYLIH